ncbi:MAG: hypothetical protein CMC96_03670 [Flavobacteriales bacterium]|nr:hypothetical protein [Flavobacteriales bacterium]|tara:strand:+ start:1561 stop:1953 length:393 start_codon:yes stop_codon:yes gene_type:complete
MKYIINNRNGKLNVFILALAVIFLIRCSNEGNIIEYYPDGSIKIEGDTLNGEYFQYYENGNVEIHGFYKNGRKDSTWTKYFESGKVEGLQQYKSGVEHGFFKVYNEEGKLVIDSEFINGKLDSVRTAAPW